MDDKTRIEELERQLAILQPIIELEKERVREEESQQARVAAWKLVTDQFTPFVENKNIHGVPHFFGCTLNGVNDGNRTIVSFRAFRTTIMGDREYINIYVMANTAEEAMKIRAASGRFVESNKDIAPDEAIGEWVGIAFISSRAVDHLFKVAAEVLEEHRFDAYDTEAFTRMAREGADFRLPGARVHLLARGHPDHCHRKRH